MALIAIGLIGNHIGLRFMELYLGHDCASGLFRLYCRMFTVNAEGMIPTMYSTVALLFCSTLLTIIALSKKKTSAKYFPHWLGLALIFLFLAMDEALEIHEQFGGPVRSALDITSGLLYFAWVIPYGFALFIFLAAYLKFITELPARTRLLPPPQSRSLPAIRECLSRLNNTGWRKHPKIRKSFCEQDAES